MGSKTDQEAMLSLLQFMSSSIPNNSSQLKFDLCHLYDVVSEH